MTLYREDYAKFNPRHIDDDMRNVVIGAGSLAFFDILNCATQFFVNSYIKLMLSHRVNRAVKTEVWRFMQPRLGQGFQHLLAHILELTKMHISSVFMKTAE